MINNSLQAFAANARQAGCISFGDVKQLQCDILPDGISSREEAELLLTLDQTVGRTDRTFADWLVAMMVDFVVWGMRPTGIVDANTAAWLAPFLSGSEATIVTCRLVQELTREAEHLDPALLTPPLSRTAKGSGSGTAGAEPMPLAA
jgi:hypothetical protein